MSHSVSHDTTEQLERQITSERAPRSVCNPSGTELDATLACAALELVTIVSDAATIEAAAAGLVNRLKAFLAADGVALGLSQSGSRCRVAAVAGATQIDRGSEMSRALESVLAEAACGVGSKAFDGCERLRPMIHGAAIERCRLATQGGVTAGAIAVWGGDSQFGRGQTGRFLRLASEPLASALVLLERAQIGPLRRALRRAFGTRRWLPWAALAAIGLCVLFLLPYRIACDCAAEPRSRRFVSAPFAGVFEKSLVRPGDVVTKDALLGQMDGRELRIELAAVTADYERAGKSHDVNLAAGKVAAAQIDRLELERLDQQRSLVEHRMANLMIRSPVAGYVIGGDLNRSEGAPLTVGQVLYEIAPLDQMIVEVAIGDDDIAQIHTGQAVSVRFDAYPGQTFVGRLVRIHPRSETRDSQNVFIGEVVLDDATSALRPGMKGRSRIVIEGKSLAGGLWERSWHAVAMFFGL